MVVDDMSAGAKGVDQAGDQGPLQEPRDDDDVVRTASDVRALEVGLDPVDRDARGVGPFVSPGERDVGDVHRIDRVTVRGEMDGVAAPPARDVQRPPAREAVGPRREQGARVRACGVLARCVPCVPAFAVSVAHRVLSTCHELPWSAHRSERGPCPHGVVDTLRAASAGSAGAAVRSHDRRFPPCARVDGQVTRTVRGGVSVGHAWSEEHASA